MTNSTRATNRRVPTEGAIVDRQRTVGVAEHRTALSAATTPTSAKWAKVRAASAANCAVAAERAAIQREHAGIVNARSMNRAAGDTVIDGIIQTKCLVRNHCAIA
jgi:hypothetical protein